MWLVELRMLELLWLWVPLNRLRIQLWRQVVLRFLRYHLTTLDIRELPIIRSGTHGHLLLNDPSILFSHHLLIALPLLQMRAIEVVKEAEVLLVYQFLVCRREVDLFLSSLNKDTVWKRPTALDVLGGTQRMVYLVLNVLSLLLLGLVSHLFL